jgi:hypothetical protein
VEEKRQAKRNPESDAEEAKAGESITSEEQA